MNAMVSARRGTTLVELLVVLVLLSVLMSIVGIALPRPDRTRSPRPSTLLVETQHAAIREARVISRTDSAGGRTIRVTAFPEGYAIADTGRGTFLTTLGSGDAPR